MTTKKAFYIKGKSAVSRISMGSKRGRFYSVDTVSANAPTFLSWNRRNGFGTLDV